WARGFMWSPQAASCTPYAGRFHASAASCVAQTIRDYPSLFKVTTPIHVSHFEFLLSSHPLVASLQFANVGESAPITFPGLDFLREQRGFEIAACGRYSPAFGCNLSLACTAHLSAWFQHPTRANFALSTTSAWDLTRPNSWTARDGSSVRFGNLQDFWSDPAQRSQAPQPVHPDHAGTSSESP
ncbi:hypothetical protein JB92DRAFT_2906120, partial [Gautieria morchelliformis]